MKTIAIINIILLLLGIFLVVTPTYCTYIGFLLVTISFLSLITLLFYDFTQKKRKYCSIILIFFFILDIAFISGLTSILSLIHITGTTTNSNEVAYLIVLGAAVNGTTPSKTLEERLCAAIDYLNMYQDTVCIVSGGKGSEEQISEAECMSLYLQSNGIAKHRIIEEAQAVNTYQNILFSMNIIKNLTDTNSVTIGVITNEFHCYRTKMVASIQNECIEFFPVRTQNLFIRLNNYIRETIAILYYTFKY